MYRQSYSVTYCRVRLADVAAGPAGWKASRSWPRRRGHVLVRNGSVVFENDRIVHAGGAFAGPVDRRIDATGKLVSPGFVNCHKACSHSKIIWKPTIPWSVPAAST